MRMRDAPINSFTFFMKPKGGTPMIHIDNLVKRYGTLVALDHLSLDIKEGEIFGLLGPKGA